LSSSILSRRRILGVAAVATGVAFIRPAPAVSFAPRSISLYNIHTGESLREVYWADGHYIRDVVRDINFILRDHHSDEVRPMNAGVLDVLSRLRDRLEIHEPIQVVCGYRSPETNHRLWLRESGVAANSYHMYGMAVDMRCEQRSLRQVHGAALSLADQCRLGGVGYYPESDFVHVDCGPQRTW
jgi:uncharacterized protein YcbK (DUF882 family)